MTLEIRSVKISSEKVLRSLIISNLHLLFDSYKILDDELPIPGAPMLIMNAMQQPVLIVFDIESASQALVKGLNAQGFIKEHRQLLGRLTSMASLATQGAPSLMIIAPEPLPGLDYLQQKSLPVMAKTFRALSVNGEMAILIEPDEIIASEAVSRTEQVTKPETDEWLDRESIHDIFNLSEEEREFFAEI